MRPYRWSAKPDSPFKVTNPSLKFNSGSREECRNTSLIGLELSRDLEFFGGFVNIATIEALLRRSG